MDHAAEVDALRTAVLTTPGDTDLTIRRASFDGTGLPDALAGYVRAVHDTSERLTDESVDALRAAGYSEDAIFEITVAAAAVGAASRRLQVGLLALEA